MFFCVRTAFSGHLITIGVIVSIVAIGFGILPGSDWTAVSYNLWLAVHVLGWAPGPSDPGLAPGVPATVPAANGRVMESQSWPDGRLFKEQFLWKRPIIFRGVATSSNGWNLECLTQHDMPLTSTLAAALNTSTSYVNAFRAPHEDSLLQKMTFAEYLESKDIEPSAKMRMLTLGKCRDTVPVDKLLSEYHSRSGIAPQMQLLFEPVNTTHRLHMAPDNTFETQIHGRKLYLFVNPDHVHRLNPYANIFNMGYLTAVDLRKDDLPPDVQVLQVTANPGDVVYFPPMWPHAIYNIGPEPSLSVEQFTVDPIASSRRNWVLTVAMILNPTMIYRLVMGQLQSTDFTTLDLYEEERKDSDAKSQETAAAECRSRFFFNMIFLSLVAAAIYNRVYRKKPHVFLLAHRSYQAYGHLMFGLGHFNDFTKFSAFAGWGLLCDATGFLIDGMVYKHNGIFIWGCIHFSHWLVRIFLPTLFMSFAGNKGMAFWSTLLLDQFFNLLALLLIAQKMYMEMTLWTSPTKPSEITRSKSAPAVAMGFNHWHESAGKGSRPASMEDFRVVTKLVAIPFLVMTSWTLLNQDKR